MRGALSNAARGGSGSGVAREWRAIDVAGIRQWRGPRFMRVHHRDRCSAAGRREAHTSVSPTVAGVSRIRDLSPHVPAMGRRGMMRRLTRPSFPPPSVRRQMHPRRCRRIHSPIHSPLLHIPAASRELPVGLRRERDDAAPASVCISPPRSADTRSARETGARSPRKPAADSGHRSASRRSLLPHQFLRVAAPSNARSFTRWRGDEISWSSTASSSSNFGV